MLCKCEACGWRGDVPGAFRPGAKLKKRACPACAGPGTLTKIYKLTARVIAGAGAHAVKLLEARAGKPAKTRTLYEETISGERKRTRAAVIQSKAIKRGLRNIASATAASAAVAREGVNELAAISEALGQVYAALNCLVTLAVELRDGAKAARPPFPVEPNAGDGGILFCTVVGAPPASPTLAGAVLEPIRERPQTGDVLTFDDGGTWTVSAALSGALHVAHDFGDGGGAREFGITREEWRTAVDRATRVKREGSIDYSRNAKPAEVSHG